MKDFYDLVALSRRFAFDGALLARAIRATFERRKTPFPSELPVGLSDEFATDPFKLTQWSAFLHKSGALERTDLSEAIREIATFVERPMSSAARGDEFAMQWPPRGPWRP